VQIFWNCLKTSGITSAIFEIGIGVRTPATTSSPWAFMRNSPMSFFSPVAGSRVKATPVPELSLRLPNAIICTFTAVPHE